jgi:hypothetical protein
VFGNGMDQLAAGERAEQNAIFDRSRIRSFHSAVSLANESEPANEMAKCGRAARFFGVNAVRRRLSENRSRKMRGDVVVNEIRHAATRGIWANESVIGGSPPQG